MCGAREAQRAHRRLGAARHEAQHLDVRHARADRARRASTSSSGRDAEARAALASSSRSASSTIGGRMAEHERAPREHVVDVLVAVDVPDARARAPRSTTNGSPPTPPKARTGEFTPPGNSSRARSMSARERDVSSAATTSVIVRSSRCSCRSTGSERVARRDAPTASRSTTRSSVAREVARRPRRPRYARRRSCPASQRLARRRAA